MVTGKCTDVFRGIFCLRRRFEGGITWEDISMEKLVMGEKNFNEGAQGFLALFEKTMKK